MTKPSYEELLSLTNDVHALNKKLLDEQDADRAELLRVRGLLQRQSEVLQRIASWDFDFYGDCVAEAKKLASDALSRADGE